MPAALSYPGVYVEEIPSGVRTITGVPTSIAAFVGRAARGPVNMATTINSYGDFERLFGGLWLPSQLGFAVRDFFLNGGAQAIIVRLFGQTLSDDDRQSAMDAAKAVADAVAAVAAGAGANAARDAATQKAATFLADPQMSAAKAVSDAAGAAAALAGATQATVAAAAAKAAATAVLGPSKAKLDAGGLTLVAANEGAWGANLRATVDVDGITADVAAAMGVTTNDLFNLTVRDAGVGGATESYANLTLIESARRIDRVLLGSMLVKWRGTLDPAAPPPITAVAKSPASDVLSTAEASVVTTKADWVAAQVSGVDVVARKALYEAAVLALQTARSAAMQAVTDEPALVALDFLPVDGQKDKHGLYALERTDIFNLLCIPPYKPLSLSIDAVVDDAATAYCEQRRAIHLVDPPDDWGTKDAARDGVASFPDSRSPNAALFFPHVMEQNLLRENRVERFAPCGVVAGVIARTDTQRGVWKASAGLDATLAGVPALYVNLTDAENGELNPLGINCLRAFPVAGRVVWGARTLRGADQLADQWKYLPVRRTALYIEESLYRGTQWVVFEPNDEPLWAQIRLNVGAFMHGMFRQGAFQGTTPRDAYLVKCDKETTTQADIDLGIVNIVVGFAPLKPAEFVVIKLQQIAGQIET